MTRPLLLAIGGPTASGKTDLAITLAQRFGGEIVNADSRQVYRGMDIGTAKPTTEQRAATPHHMLDVVSPDEDYTLALFARQAHETIAAIAGRGALPILVGGTGLYIRAVARGFSVPEVPPNLALRTELQQLFEAQGIDSLLDRLRTLDPAGAAVIDGKNPRRLIRAIEVC
ncbi:MAG: miaA, partial [Chloroflexi bacterium]|nr:miaA [Chloroflexota bacterium]